METSSLEESLHEPSLVRSYRLEKGAGPTFVNSMANPTMFHVCAHFLNKNVLDTVLVGTHT